MNFLTYAVQFQFLLSFLRRLLFRCPKAAASTCSRKYVIENLLTYPVYGSLLWYEAGKFLGEILKNGLANESY